MESRPGARLAVIPVAALLVVIAAGGARAQFDARVGGPTAPGVAGDYAVVRFVDTPTASYEGGVPGLNRTKPQPGQRLDLGSGAARAYRSYLARKRQAFEAHLRRAAPKAAVLRRYDVVFNGVAVRLNGEALDALAAAPHVAAVKRSGLLYKAMNVSVGHVRAPELWSRIEAAGLGRPGAGVKVGVIDSGLDQRHVFLDQSADELGSPGAGFPKGDTRFTSAKVIVARAYFTGATGAHTAEAIDSHGTHVAGIIAGRPYQRPADAGFLAGGEVSGVAPYAFLGNYNVFPGNLASAYEHDVAQAVEDAVIDGMDVLNMSLGGPVDGAFDLSSLVVDAATDAGVVVAVAAGNDGPGRGTVGSPGVAENAITAGASTNPHLFGILVSVAGPGSVPADLQGLKAAAGVGPAVQPPHLESGYVDWDSIDGSGSGLACEAVAGAPLEGRIALVNRGGCFFSTKVNNAAAAGAIAVVVRNNAGNDPVSMAMADPTTIPAVMVSRADGQRLAGWVASHPSATARLHADVKEFPTPDNADHVAGFSARGPTPVRERIKPDLTAPGVNVYSSIVTPAHDRFEAFHGTSAATPHVAGSAALVRQLHPDWSPEQIKSALVNTAGRAVTDRGAPAGVLVQGAGRLDLGRAAVASATFAPVSISFGRLEPNANWAESAPVDVTNHGVAGKFSFTVEQTRPLPAGGEVSVTPSATLRSGETAPVTLKIQVPRTAPSGDYEGYVNVTAPDGSTYHVPYWFRIGAP